MYQCSESSSGSVSQRYGSEDPDPYQNVTDPQLWCLCFDPSSAFSAELNVCDITLWVQVKCSVYCCLELIHIIVLLQDADSYIHRVGRTARAGQTGTALSLVAGMPIEIPTCFWYLCFFNIKYQLWRNENLRLRLNNLTGILFLN
jgi:hypothetical protein